MNLEQNKKQPTELAHVFQMHSDSYLKNHTLSPEQHKVVNAILNCRTLALGGHINKCNHCDTIVQSYNSCRNRHCPKCESFKSAKWLEDKQSELLPVSYFHVVFTLPHALNNLVLYNKKTLYHLLFKSAWLTVKKLGADPNRLNGEMGMTAILHTWGQNLTVHNHVHCIVPGGALSPHEKWNPSRKNYLFPVKVMSRLFRGIYLSELKELHESNKLIFPNQLNSERTDGTFTQLMEDLRKNDWIVYAKEPFAGPKSLLNYLGRYTHKIAISNYRILSCDMNEVKFKWRDYSDNNKMKIMSLKPSEFIRRFLSHVLPGGFMRIRSYGFLGSASKRKKIKQIQELLNYQPPIKDKTETAVERMYSLTGEDITICPFCKKGKLERIGEFPRDFGVLFWDTS